MPLRSVFEIDIGDAAFKKFKDLWDRWQTAAGKSPSILRSIRNEITAARLELEKYNNRLTVGGELIVASVRGTRALGSATHDAVIRWTSLDRLTLRVASNIRSATGYLLKVSGIASAVGGLVGIGSLFGLDSLAGSVGARRRSAFGLGTTIGGQTSFATNFGRLVDPDSFLSGVAGAKQDVTQRVGLLGAGLSAGEINGDTATTSVALLRNLKRIADTTNPALYGQIIQARQLGNFVSPQDLQRLHAMSPQEFNQLISQYQTGKGQFAVPPDVARQWQDLSTQLSRAGQGIENTFIRGLAPLTPALSKLSESFEKVIHSFLASPTLGKWIETVDKALEKFAGYVGTDDFQQKVAKFADGVGKIADAVGSAVSWFAGDVTDAAPARAQGAANANQLRADRASGKSSIWSQLGDVLTGQSPAAVDDILARVKRAERSGASAVSPKDAIGEYQVLPSTAAMYGITREQLFDPAKNKEAARKYVEMLVKKYHGNVANVLGAYNAGPGQMDDVLAGKKGLPGETQRYIQHGLSGDGYSPTVVTINDNTGGNVVTSVNGLKN